ncbi:M48 family metallopeptidase [Fictibacillus nanhaiensis]|uniref:M48 family metallopeptidase n=1 Tax=Fictibacillus nanhaiensis TaxID=742169 RepID=UPI001FE69E34|nr:M48 family metallopeptidase [Fictibacillus nanhaiensis]
MKKSMLFLVGFAIYGALMWYYLFQGAESALPVHLKGSAADPAMFMTDRELELSTDFSRIKDFLYFISVPLEWLIYLFVLGFGLSGWFRKASSGLTKFSIVHTGVYVLLLSFVSWLLTFPLRYYSFTISKSYKISVQSFHSWMRDGLVDFWISWVLTTLMVAVMYWLIKRNEKRWWLYAWLLSIPFTLFLYFIQPVVIDPLYNKFYPLQDEVLKEKILDIADKADIPAENVYEVNMSEKTNALNAYVNGIGSNLRIVLWDTTLNKLTDNQVLFVMAHEIGHYVMDHLYWNLLSSIVLSFLGLWLGNMIYRRWVEKYGKTWGIKGVGDLAALPALLLIFSLLSFAVSPIENAVSRKAERDADLYAIQMTKNQEAAVGAFQELATVSLSEVNPPKIVKWFLYGHPTMLERIHFLESFNTSNTIQKEQK